MMSPPAEQIHYSTETFNKCRRLVHSGRVQAGIQYLMRRWRAIPEALQTPFLHAEFLTLPADTQAGITERTAALRHQRRERRAQNTRLEAVEAGINAAYRKRWHRLCGMAALCALAALLLSVYNAL
jgi:hypothetical protein